jgi:NhaA family Na+:H+ antiporter
MPILLLTGTFNRFFESEKAGGLLLIIATIISVAVTNSALGPQYLEFWQIKFAGLTLEHWVNDGLMAIFFLMIGLELEREMYIGELSNLRNALLPIFAAAGGMLAPALLHYAFNTGLPTQPGVGIPMATDIAFALGALALLGKRIPTSLKVFVVAFAVIDDLGAIVMSALFYTDTVAVNYLVGSLAVWVVLLSLNRFFRVAYLPVYLVGGALMWVLMLKSGVHATVAGVMLAFAIPFWRHSETVDSPSYALENFLHRPVAFVVLPIFALANTGILIGSGWLDDLSGPNAIGIISGLVIGKPLGVVVLSLIAVMLGVCSLPSDLRWRHLIGAGMLGGIGFTMSIFITNLAFADQPDVINASKMAVFAASLLAGVLGFLWLRFCGTGEPATEEQAVPAPG